ncbi:succinic semialdehyde dehydrogenase [Achlya hypogyna]|uniref:Succinate-semialdehyde dehydrogenase, mitochondrial n=1 Tax=Achlya hypogyna TaxID=1202772 RepID=A0A1V9Z6P1_ACHHY|nr:succinic semialdehyde dehydrogenase [Achlya hypogyna]
MTLATSFKGLLRRPDLIQSQGYIGGRWLNAISGTDMAHAKTPRHECSWSSLGHTYTVTDPSLDTPLGHVAAMTAEDTHVAIAAAEAAFQDWKKTTPTHRGAILQKWDRLLRENEADLGMIMAKESGKPIAEAIGEVSYAADYLKFFGHEALRSEGFMIPSHANGRRMMALRQPVGVCGMITPWNFPIGMLARKVGPALAAGCTAVVKPAAATPLSALAFAKLGEEAGVPAGVMNIVPSPHESAAEIGRTLCETPQVRKLTFTGSTTVGKQLTKQCAATLKRVSMELGGLAPFIVFDDADIPAAVEGLVQGKFRNTGQTCVCPNRVYVQAGSFDAFAEQLVARVAQLKQGIAHERGFDLGPLINPGAVDKLTGVVAEAIAHGAKPLLGATPSVLGPAYMTPTVLTDVTPAMRVAQEECFGPIVALQKFHTEDEVVAAANATEMGLAAYCYTKDLGRAWRMSENLEAGMVGINVGLISAVQAPFGGIKQSGLGREGSIVGMEDYTELKYVCMGGLA